MRIIISHVIALDPALSKQVDHLIDAIAGIDGSTEQAIIDALDKRATALEALTKPKET